MPHIEISSELDVLNPAPVRLPIPKGTDLAHPLHLKEESGARVFPVQHDGDHLVALVSGLHAGKAERYRLERAAAASMVSVKPESGDRLSIVLPEGPFTSYHFASSEPRPFFWPVLGPGAKKMSRGFPMEPQAGEDHDHPHHRSFWSAYGEVNGVDDWSQEKNHGWIRHKQFTHQTSGPVYGGFEATAIWTSNDDKPLLDERRAIRVYNVGPDRRLLDYEIHLAASYDDVHYGDTKEGGILSWRVASTMDGKRGGLMENSLGGKTEKEVWGKHAAWLDYSGDVDGERLGIAMMDHPGNLHHPCRWHARDYGLVGTNPFANAAFGEGDKNGYVQKKGDTLNFYYRVLIHRGGAKEGHVDDAFHAWVQGPKARGV